MRMRMRRNEGAAAGDYSDLVIDGGGEDRLEREVRQQQNAITRKRIGKLQLRSIHPGEEKKRDVIILPTYLTIATTDCRDAASERVWIVGGWER